MKESIKKALDEKSIKILNLLMEDSRLSFRQIAKRLDMSVSSVMLRIKKLEELGIIKRYTIEVDYKVLGFDLPVLIELRVSKGMLFEVEKIIAKHPNVLGVYDITGDFDVAVFAVFRNREELDRFVKKLQKLEYVERTYTKIILNIIKNERNMDLSTILNAIKFEDN